MAQAKLAEALINRLKGGPGSGYRSPHYGRPGTEGGSLPRSGGYSKHVLTGIEPFPNASLSTRPIIGEALDTPLRSATQAGERDKYTRMVKSRAGRHPFFSFKRYLNKYPDHGVVYQVNAPIADVIGLAMNDPDADAGGGNMVYALISKSFKQQDTKNPYRITWINSQGTPLAHRSGTLESLERGLLNFIRKLHANDMVYWVLNMEKPSDVEYPQLAGIVDMKE